MRLLSADRRNFSNQVRSGYTLVFFAMLMFGLMGMAALVIDLGFARLTQRQMQTAVDSASLEGLRGAGNINYTDRQNAAKGMATLHFDDDLDQGADDGAFDSGSGQFGAGPLVDFAGGAGDPSLVASQTMSVDPDNPVYKPEFVDGVESATGFQAAMLRGGTADPAADVFSVGPSVPYLFARGSLINRQLIQAGLTVRATGIADARPAVAVGVNIPGVLVGSQNFAIHSATWSSLLPDDGDPMTDESSVIPVDGIVSGSTAAVSRHVGGTLSLLTVPVAANGYVPIFDDINGTNRVVGFGVADIMAESASEVRITKRTPLDGLVAKENATAMLSAIVDELTPLSNADRDELLDKNRNLVDPLLAPVSVR